jgi:uncharacterized membrane protein
MTSPETESPRHRNALERARRLAEARRARKAPRAVDVAAEFQSRMSRGDRAADAFARVVGSWRFIGIQTAVLAVWVALNVVAAIHHWDPYPFILLNLVLSFQAAYAAPIIMMSQNRAAILDRMAAQADFGVNQHAEAEVEEVLALLHAQVGMLEEVRAQLAELRPLEEG